jgi:chromosome segregation ATPase
MQEEMKALEMSKKKLEEETNELNKVVKKLVDERTDRDKEIEQLKKKVSALCQKFFLLELEKENPISASNIESRLSPKTRAEQDKALDVAVSAFESPMQSLTRFIILLLKDERNMEMRPYLENILGALASLNVYSPDFQELFSETGLDSVTQSWMLYEFSR